VTAHLSSFVIGRLTAGQAAPKERRGRPHAEDASWPAASLPVGLARLPVGLASSRQPAANRKRRRAHFGAGN